MRAQDAKLAKPDESASGFRDVLRVRAFAVLYTAEVQSIIGDQFARVALSVLIFARTGSAWATALVYGLTYLPAVLGGFALASVGDRFPRRAVMITCDLVRAAVFVAMAVPAVPIGGVAALLVVAVFLTPAFSSSSIGYLSASLTPAQFRTASGLRMTTSQVAQVVGFAVGGVLAAAIGARDALLVNAATFVISAGAVWLGLGRGRPVRPTAPAPADAASNGVEAESVDAALVVEDAAMGDLEPDVDGDESNLRGVRVLRLVFGTRLPRTMMLLSLLAGLFVVPESLAVPYAAHIHAGTTFAGLLLAVIPLGSALGIVLMVRLVPAARRRQAAFYMALATGVPLIFTALGPHEITVSVLWFLSGVFGAYQVEAIVTVISSVPASARSSLASVSGSLLLTSQGVGPLVFGAVASAVSSAAAVAIAGAIGAVVAAAVLVRFESVAVAR